MNMENSEIEILSYQLEDLYLRLGSLIKELPKQYDSLNKEKLMTKENSWIIK